MDGDDDNEDTYAGPIVMDALIDSDNNGTTPSNRAVTPSVGLGCMGMEYNNNGTRQPADK